MNNFIEIENLQEVNGGGLLGAAVGAVVGATYGLAAGAVVASNTGDFSDVFETAWACTMLGGAIGAVIPEP